jgi:hypothetical protein
MPGPKSAPVLHAVRGADTMIGPALPAPDTSLTTRPDPMVAPVTRGARHAPVSIPAELLPSETDPAPGASDAQRPQQSTSRRQP